MTLFQYAPHIAPICLPEAGRDPAPGTQAYVAGWGALIPDDVTGPLISILVPEVKRPSVLQVVNVPIVANDRCESWHRDAGIQVSSRNGGSQKKEITSTAIFLFASNSNKLCSKSLC